MKLQIKKVTTLSSKDLANVNGGGIDRSNRRLTNCDYSRAHAATQEYPDPQYGCIEITSCVSKDDPRY